jgi:hypothetical protein
LVEVGFTVDVLAAGALSQWGKEQSSSFHSTIATSFEQTDWDSTTVELGLDPLNRRPCSSTRVDTPEHVATA